MVIKMTKRELLDLDRGLQNVGNLSGPRFVYAIARNSFLLKGEVTSLQKSIMPSASYNIYDQARLALAKEHSVKEGGIPKTFVENNIEQYLMKDLEKFNIAFENLKKEHSAALEERKLQIEAFNTLLTEEIEIDLCEIALEDIPDGISAQQLSGIFSIVVDSKVKI